MNEGGSKDGKLLYVTAIRLFHDAAWLTYKRHEAIVMIRSETQEQNIADEYRDSPLLAR